MSGGWHGVRITEAETILTCAMNATVTSSSDLADSRPRRTLRGALRVALAALLLVGSAVTPANANSRIKDIADFEGVRENLLVGYGLVVGLNGTGDTLTNSPFTKQSL